MNSNSTSKKSFSEEFEEFQKCVEGAEEMFLAAKQIFLRVALENLWNERYKDIPPPSRNKNLSLKFYLKFMDRLKVAFSNSSVKEQCCFEAFL